MALTRTFLKTFDLDDKAVSEIIAAHVETTDALKEERDNYKKDAEKFKKDAEKLTDVEKELNDLKNGEDWQKKYEKEHADFEAYKTASQNEKTAESKKAAFEQMLKGLKISEKAIPLIMKGTNYDDIELDDKGAIKDLDKLKESAKKEYAGFIVKDGRQGARTETPLGSSGGAKTKEEIYKRDDNGRYVLSASERQKALSELYSSENE